MGQSDHILSPSEFRLLCQDLSYSSLSDLGLFGTFEGTLHSFDSFYDNFVCVCVCVCVCS